MKQKKIKEVFSLGLLSYKKHCLCSFECQLDLLIISALCDMLLIFYFCFVNRLKLTGINNKIQRRVGPTKIKYIAHDYGPT